MEVTKWLKPSVSGSRYTVTARVCRPRGVTLPSAASPAAISRNDSRGRRSLNRSRRGEGQGDHDRAVSEMCHQSDQFTERLPQQRCRPDKINCQY
jgi:hypothetical protein